MSIQEGAERAKLQILNAINKTNNLEIPKIEVFRKNIGKIFQVSISEIETT